MPQRIPPTFPKPDDIVHCGHCHTDKFAADFYRNTGRRNGLQSWCKLCVDTASKEAKKRRTRARQEQRHRNVLIGSGVTIHAGQEVRKLPPPPEWITAAGNLPARVSPRDTAVTQQIVGAILAPITETENGRQAAPQTETRTPSGADKGVSGKEEEKLAPPAERTITLGEWLRNEETVSGRFTNGYGARLFVCESGQFAVSRETSGGSYNLWHLTSEFKQAKDRAFSGQDLTALLSYVAPDVLQETGRIYKR